MTDITHRVLKALSKTGLEYDWTTITPATSLVDDLGCDSLDLLDIHLAVEDEFDEECSDAELETLRTVGDIVALIEAKLGAERTVGAA